jgi:3-oxoacyl-[acyl-carrier-protein] synthase-3
VDGIIAGSMSYERAFPALACLVAKEVGCTNAFAVDITLLCCDALRYQHATLMIRAGQAKNILVVGAEICSRIVDWSDRATCVLFGDAAGALLLSATEENRGVLASTLKADGRQGDILYLGGESKFLKMDGAAVFKLAVTELAAVTKQTLEKVEYIRLTILDLFGPHQAEIASLKRLARVLALRSRKSDGHCGTLWQYIFGFDPIGLV